MPGRFRPSAPGWRARAYRARSAEYGSSAKVSVPVSRRAVDRTSPAALAAGSDQLHSGGKPGAGRTGSGQHRPGRGVGAPRGAAEDGDDRSGLDRDRELEARGSANLPGWARLPADAGAVGLPEFAGKCDRVLFSRRFGLLRQATDELVEKRTTGKRAKRAGPICHQCADADFVEGTYFASAPLGLEAVPGRSRSGERVCRRAELLAGGRG